MALAIGVALAFRLAALDARPMHHDEANQAIRFGQLLETGDYRYEAADHHGPTLYYLTLPAAWLRRQQTTASLDERTLRLVPAAFGAGLLLLLLPLVKGAGRSAVVVAAALLAVAPPLTYYGRFYIQETLLLFFTTGFLVAAGRYALEGGWGAALWAGAFAGLALATKETAALLIPAALAGCAAARRWGRPASRAVRKPGAQAREEGHWHRARVGRGSDRPRHRWAVLLLVLHEPPGHPRTVSRRQHLCRPGPESRRAPGALVLLLPPAVSSVLAETWRGSTSPCSSA